MEEVLKPSLRGKPIGIKQKYLLVTCNYTARSLGVRKMESLVEVSGALAVGLAGCVFPLDCCVEKNAGKLGRSEGGRREERIFSSYCECPYISCRNFNPPCKFRV